MKKVKFFLGHFFISFNITSTKKNCHRYWKKIAFSCWYFHRPYLTFMIKEIKGFSCEPNFFSICVEQQNFRPPEYVPNLWLNVFNWLELSLSTLTCILSAHCRWLLFPLKILTLSLFCFFQRWLSSQNGGRVWILSFMEKRRTLIK